MKSRPIMTVLMMGLILLVGTIAGCISLKRYYRFISSEERPPIGSRVLIEPILVSRNLPKSYDNGLLTLRKMIGKKLSEAGFSVLTEDETTAALLGLSPQGKNLYDPATGNLDLAKIRTHKSRYISELSKRDACEIVASSRVSLRESEYMGTVARWDGVTRDLRLDYTRMGAGRITMKGHGSGLSLGIQIYDMHDRILQQSWGGIDLFHRVGKIFTKKNRHHLEIRENALDDKKMLAEAVSLALHPFIPYIDYPENPVFQKQ